MERPPFAVTGSTLVFSIGFISIAVFLGLIQLRIEKELGTLRENLLTCNSQTESLNGTIHSLNDLICDQNAHAHNLKATTRSLSAQLSSQNAQTNNQGSLIKRLTAQINSQTAQMHDLIDQVHSQKAQIEIFVGYGTSQLGRIPRGFLNIIYQPPIRNEAVIGIDLGSKFSHSAVYLSGKVHRIPHYDHSGEIYNSMANYIGFDNYEDYVGQSAQTIVKSSTIFSSIIYDVISFLRHEIYLEDNRNRSTAYIDLGFAPEPNNENQSAVVLANDKKYSLVLILSKLFHKLRENASKYLNFPPSKCVIAHGFVKSTNQMQRAILFDAAKLAGFKRIDFLDPHAAAVIGLVPTISSLMRPQVYLFINLGARYWRFSVVEVYQGNIKRLEGGITYDSGYLQNDLMNYCLEEFSDMAQISDNELKTDSFANKVRFRLLHESCERAMISLSTSETTTIHVPEFYDEKNLTLNITRVKFEELIAEKLKVIGEHSNTVMHASGISRDSIDEVILVGGCSRIPRAQEIVQSQFGKKKVTRLMGIEPDEAVAFGAAVHGAILAAEQI